MITCQHWFAVPGTSKPWWAYRMEVCKRNDFYVTVKFIDTKLQIFFARVHSNSLGIFKNSSMVLKDQCKKIIVQERKETNCFNHPSFWSSTRKTELRLFFIQIGQGEYQLWNMIQRFIMICINYTKAKSGRNFIQIKHKLMTVQHSIKRCMERGLCHLHLRSVP